MEKNKDFSYSVVFNKMSEIKESNTIYTIGKESRNIQELRKLSNQLNKPQVTSYSFS
ncbi:MULTISPECIES: hypothetical protein [Cytobacillus]|uniref:hypothetical protein n=1 Tax=Cytobacillus TaxID=2675230 RepID=UPI0018CC9C65|nr:MULTISPECIES: hypothetical protein [Cytobacillus]MDK7664393.1 hypothetical protein [Cytobacillus oceanisediminis]MED1908878.1 hypothetical protein [Cytobacillus firmus]